MSGIRISGTHTSSSDTPHTAMATADGWRVSWLPGRTLDRNQATTAMVIANIVGSRGVGLSEDPIWPHLDNWAAELGLCGADAVVRASEPPVPDDQAATATATAEPSVGPRLCAHADRDGTDAHWLPSGTVCQAEPSHEREAGA
jgi:hypothetical protein